MLTIENKIKQYQEALQMETYPAHFIIGVLFGLRLALYITQLKEGNE